MRLGYNTNGLGDHRAQEAIALIAERGVAPITHRLVAARAGALLAATTYYFETKQDLVAEASNELLRSYLADFAEVAATASGQGPADFRRFVAERIEGALGQGPEPTQEAVKASLVKLAKQAARKLAPPEPPRNRDPEGSA